MTQNNCVYFEMHISLLQSMMHKVVMNLTKGKINFFSDLRPGKNWPRFSKFEILVEVASNLIVLTKFFFALHMTITNQLISSRHRTQQSSSLVTIRLSSWLSGFW